MLSLRDPADETNDLGRKGVAIRHFQATCRSLYQHVEYNTKTNTRASLLGPLVGPSYQLNNARRRKLEAYGRRLMTQMQSSLAAKAQAIRDAENAENTGSTEDTSEQIGGQEGTEQGAKE